MGEYVLSYRASNDIDEYDYLLYNDNDKVYELNGNGWEPRRGVLYVFTARLRMNEVKQSEEKWRHIFGYFFIFIFPPFNSIQYTNFV